MSTTGPKVAVTFGSKFEGSDGVIFSGSDGTGFDATNSGAIALGFFTPTFDLNKAVLRGDMTQILGISIHSTVQVLMQRQLLVISQRVEQLPRMVLAHSIFANLKGVTALAEANTAKEYGLFTHSGFAKIPEGGNPFPVEYDIASMQFDDVVIGKEIAGGGFGDANAYATAEVVLSQEDVVPPDLYLRGGSEITVEMGLPFDDPGFIATDDEDGDLGHLVVVSGFVDTDKEGDYILKYNVSDTAGNVASELERKVSVVFIDRKAPVIVLKGDVLLSLLVGDSFTDPGATATDETDGDLSSTISVTGVDEVSTDSAGVYLVRYNVADAAGNHALQVTRTVVVKQPILPEISIANLTDTGGTIDLTVEITSDYDDEVAKTFYAHWIYSIDTPLVATGPAGGIPVVGDSITQSGIVVDPGTVVVHVGLVNSDGELVGEAFSRAITILGTSTKKIRVFFGSPVDLPEKSLFKNSSNESANYSFGFFNPGFDLDAAINSGKQAEILANFNSLAHTKAVAHYESISENGVGETPYIIAYTGISDLILDLGQHSPPWEIAMSLTNSTFPKIPAGAEARPPTMT